MASISAQIQKLYDLGFAALASVMREGLLVRTTGSSYDPNTGSVAEESTSFSVKGIFRTIKLTEAGPNVLSSDRIFVTRRKYLNDFIPDPETDYMIVDGEKFSIVPPLREDPMRDIVALQLRRMT